MANKKQNNVEEEEVIPTVDNVNLVEEVEAGKRAVNDIKPEDIITIEELFPEEQANFLQVVDPDYVEPEVEVTTASMDLEEYKSPLDFNVKTLTDTMQEGIDHFKDLYAESNYSEYAILSKDLSQLLYRILRCQNLS